MISVLRIRLDLVPNIILKRLKRAKIIITVPFSPQIHLNSIISILWVNYIFSNQGTPISFPEDVLILIHNNWKVSFDFYIIIWHIHSSWIISVYTHFVNSSSVSLDNFHEVSGSDFFLFINSIENEILIKIRKLK